MCRNFIHEKKLKKSELTYKDDNIHSSRKLVGQNFRVYIKVESSPRVVVCDIAASLKLNFSLESRVSS